MILQQKVVWTEGMLIRPQHFQQQERYFEKMVHARFNSLVHDGWGLLSYQIDQVLLQNNRISLNYVSGVFRDGTFFNCPYEDRLPNPIVPPQTTANQLVYLAIPYKQEFISETTDTASNHIRYTIKEQEIADVNADYTSQAAINVGELNIKLLLESEHLDQYVTIPIAKINEITADGVILLDEYYIPPCLDISVVPRLAAYAQEVLTLVQFRAERLAEQVIDINRQISGVVDYLMLQILNRYEPLLTQFTQGLKIHPFTFYCLLLELVGEMATYTQASKRANVFAKYNHSDLAKIFNALMLELRQEFNVVLERDAFTIELLAQPYGVQLAQLPDKQLIEKADFILSVRCSLPAESFLARFPNQIKVGTSENILQLINAQLPGCKVQPLAVTPPQIPFHYGDYYFALAFSADEIEQIKKAGQIALQVSGDFPDLVLSLWVVRR